MKKIIYSLMGVIVLIFVFTGFAKQREDKVVLRFGYASNSDVVKESMAEFGRILNEKSNGEITVQYFPDSQLGGERELIELTQTGAIDFTKVSGAALESFSEAYSIFSLPYLFDSEEHFYDVMEDELMDEIYSSTDELNFLGLTYYDSGQRSFYTKDKPINHPDDLTGMKIRVMQSQTAIRMIELLGGLPTPLAGGEVYTALQQGLLDGAENNEFAITAARHGEVANYYSYDSHTRVPDIVIVNKETLDKLTPENRRFVMEAAAESTDYQIRRWAEAVAEARSISENVFGVKFNNVDLEPFQERVMPLHKEFSQKEGIGDIYNKIRELADKGRKS